KHPEGWLGCPTFGVQFRGTRGFLLTGSGPYRGLFMAGFFWPLLERDGFSLWQKWRGAEFIRKFCTDPSEFLIQGCLSEP
ncbi:hypothetical protein, partial [Halomonas shantousis]